MTSSAFGFEQPEQSPGFLLWQVSVIWQRRIRLLLDQHGLSHAQFVLLAILLWCEEQTISPIQSYLVKQSKLDKMTVSAGLNKLCHSKLIVRETDAVDTRAKVAKLTSTGRILIKRLIPQIEQIDRDFFAKLGQTEQQKIVSALHQLVSLSDDS